MRKLTFGLLAAGAASLLVFAACGSSSDSDTPPAGTGGTAGQAGKAGSGGQAGGQAGGGGGQAGEAGQAGGGGSAGGGPPNQDCASAETLTLGTPVTSYLWPKGARLAYKVDLKADEWVQIGTETLYPDADAGVPCIDSTISLYEGDTQLAFDDDSVPWLNRDAVMQYHAPKDMTLCIMIDDVYVLTGQAGTYVKNHDDAKVTVSVGDLDPTKFTIDKETNNDVASAQALNLLTATDGDGGVLGYLAYVGGVLTPEGDVDVYKFKVPSQMNTLSLAFTPTGKGQISSATTGFGQTIDPESVAFADATGKIFSRVNTADFPWQAASPYFDVSTIPVTPDADMLMMVKRPTGPLGSNDFYIVKQQLAANSNTPEKETAGGNTNNTMETAELACATPPDGATCQFTDESSTAGTRAYYFMGHIDPATDIDYIGFEVAVGDVLTLVCSSRRSGSGLISPTFAWVQPDGDGGEAVMQSEAEKSDTDLYWTDNTQATTKSNPGITFSKAGWTYLKISATGQETDNFGNYYFCGAYIQTP